MLSPKVYTFIQRDQKVLFLRRFQTGWYDGCWCPSAGRIEPFESPVQAAIRETKEELGLKINPDYIGVVYAKVPHLRPDKSPYYEDISFFFKAECPANQIPSNQEPEKHDLLEQFSWDSLPTPLMPIVHAGVEIYLQGKNYQELGY